MCVSNLRSHKVALVTLFCLTTFVICSPMQNYTEGLLRHAKAAEMLAFIDTDYKFCDDFYKFACANWKRTHPASDSVTKTSYLGQLKDLFKRKSVDMLKSERHSDRNYQEKLKHFFGSCSNEDALAKSGLEPIIKVVDFKGGWPRIKSTSWYESEYDWLRTIAELRRKLGVDIFVGLEIIPDFEDRDMNRIKIGAPKLHLGSRDAYLKSSYASEREEYMYSIAKKLRKYFSYMPSNWAHEVAKQILNIERELAKGLPFNPALTILQTTRKRYASELKAAYGNYVDLSNYLRIVFNQTIQSLVYETPEDYMSNLVDVIKQTPKLTIANYTMWRVLEAFDFAGAINDEHNDDWCVERIMEYFPNHLEDMFHSHFNSIPLHTELLTVWKDIKDKFHGELKTASHLNWMSQETRQKAILKLEQMSIHVQQHDQDALENEILALYFDKYKYYDNLLQVLQWHTERQLSQLNMMPQTEQKSEIELPTYEYNKNRITVPIVFLQSRFLWDAAYPHALKYSTIGVLIAQQMLHGFDVEGRKYDKHGNHRSWWDVESEAAYDKRSECVSKQYENLKFNGKIPFDEGMLSEIITFNGALGIAYRTYVLWKSNTPESNLLPHESLPKLYYQPQQLFFLGFAQLWCSDYDDDVAKFSHLPERLSVNGALANLHDFSNEVSCKSDSHMNPTTKCIIF